MRRLKILTWHTHGAYLRYLTQAPHDFYVLSRPGRPPGYAGRAGSIPWGPNVHDMPVESLGNREFDCILFQDDAQYLVDQFEILTAGQRALPKIYLEHDPPRDHPTDARHPVRDPGVLLVHVTQFNRLMWDSGTTPARVIEHGVIEPSVRWTGEFDRGLVVINNIASRGRRLGWDLYQQARQAVALDLVGMGAEAMTEVAHADLPRFAAPYRFFFHPARYTSLGLAVIEAMLLGMPVVALATTEMSTLIRDGENGFAATNPAALVEAMRHLLRDPGAAGELGRRGREAARARFGIARFVNDWNRSFADVVGYGHARHAA
jgi:hypothetical protein